MNIIYADVVEAAMHAGGLKEIKELNGCGYQKYSCEKRWLILTVKQVNYATGVERKSKTV